MELNQDENKNVVDFVNFSFNNLKSNKASGYKLAIKIISFIAFIFFGLNILLMGYIFYNIKNTANKRLNVNYYSVNVSESGGSTYAVQSAWQSSVCVSAGGVAYDENSFFNETGSRGSGVIIDIDYENSVVYILTCYHVISGYVDRIYVLFPSAMAPQNASLVGYSNKYDIAVLKTKYSENLQNCFKITTKNSQLLSIGENVFAVGNSLSGGLSATCGIISRVNKEILVERSICREIQTDAPINPGNSGGGLFNIEGQFVGLINAKLNYSAGADETTLIEGMSFAIPGTLAVNIARSIINNNGFPTRVELGISFENFNSNISISNIEDNLVTDYEVRATNIRENFPADNFILLNDVILSFKYVDLDGNTQEVYMSNKYCFEDVAFDIKFNSSVEFNIIRPFTNEHLSLKVPANYQYVQI